MRIQNVIETINQMQADGVIERYAIGGAVGATFYLEPVATLDATKPQTTLERHGLVAAWQRLERRFLAS